MYFAPALHAEWLKIRTLRSLVGSLGAVLIVTAAFTALAAHDAGGPDTDRLYAAFIGVNLGQIAAIAFGTTAMSAEFHGGALRLSLAAVPDRSRWFTAKAAAVTLPALAVGLLTGLTSLAVGKAVLGADGPGWGEGVRAAVGCALYLTLMALLATGLAAVLRSGVATLSIVIPPADRRVVRHRRRGGRRRRSAARPVRADRPPPHPGRLPRPVERSRGHRAVDGGGPRRGRVEGTAPGRVRPPGPAGR
ncbi:hypothetical protein GCM10020256_67220 [Streptomyces thermocoprophilus]